MKTTIEITDDLARKAKALAARRKTTLRALIETGLRRTLAEERATPGFVLPDRSIGGEGLQSEFRGRSWSEIRDAAYEGHGS
jgi:hypothetical protein